MKGFYEGVKMSWFSRARGARAHEKGHLNFPHEEDVDFWVDGGRACGEWCGRGCSSGFLRVGDALVLLELKDFGHE